MRGKGVYTHHTHLSFSHIFFIYFIYVYTSVCSTNYMYIVSMQGLHRPDADIGSPGTGTIVVNHLVWMLETELGSLAKTASLLSC